MLLHNLVYAEAAKSSFNLPVFAYVCFLLLWPQQGT